MRLRPVRLSAAWSSRFSEEEPSSRIFTGPTLDDPRCLGQALGLVDNQDPRVAEGAWAVGGRQGGRGLEARLVHRHVEVEKDRPPSLHDMLDQCRLTDLAGAEDDPDLVARDDLSEDRFRRSFEVHNQ